MVKKIFIFMIILGLFIGVDEVNAEETYGKTIKKVVSIVYDDSSSMNNSNEDWAYASYSMQNLIGLMNSYDELNVVKMSSPSQNISIDLSTNKARKSDIKQTEKWKPIGNTPFTAVETAVNWLKDRKSAYADSQTVEFWLVLITDGSIYGYPNDMVKYLNNLKQTMGNSKFEGVFVAIGTSVPDYVKGDWTKVTGNHLITASNSGDIVDAMFEVSGLILGQGTRESDLNIRQGDKKNEITFETYFPLKKFIVYQQNQNVEIKNIMAGEADVSVIGDFETRIPGYKGINSRIIHCEGVDGDYIPAGTVSVTFDRDIDISQGNFKILAEPAINVELKVLDKLGNEINDISSVYFSEGEAVTFVAVVKSSVDLMPIDLSSWSKELNAMVVVNDESILMKYNKNDNAFYGSYKVKLGNNLAYSIVTLPGYFRAKSDMLSLYAVEKLDEGFINLDDNNISISYKYVEEYEEVSSFTYEISGETTKGKCSFSFKNIPSGITISVNDEFVDKLGNVLVEVYNGIPVDIKIYRNKDYVLKENSKIILNVSSKDYLLTWKEDSFREIILNPVKRKITTEIFKIEENNSFKLNQIENNSIYIISVLADNDYLTEDELETLIMKHIKIKGIELFVDVISYNGRYALEVRCNKILPEIFIKIGEIISNITLETIYGEKSDNFKIVFYVKDSFTKYIFPILLLTLFVLIIGYLPGVKKRLNSKRYYIFSNGEDCQICINMVSRLIPYVSEKGYGSDLMIMASGNKNMIYVLNNYDNDVKIYVNDEVVDDTRKIILYVSDRLRIIDGNRDTVYIFQQCNNDLVNLDDDISQFDDIKNVSLGKVSKNDSYDDDFFG